MRDRRRCSGFDGEYGSEVLFDAEVGYTIAEKYTISIGAQDLFDEYPGRIPERGDHAARSIRRFRRSASTAASTTHA